MSSMNMNSFLESIKSEMTDEQYKLFCKTMYNPIHKKQLEKIFNDKLPPLECKFCSLVAEKDDMCELCAIRIRNKN